MCHILLLIERAGLPNIRTCVGEDPFVEVVLTVMSVE